MLPNDLETSLRSLDPTEFDRLLVSVMKEAARRKHEVATSPSLQDATPVAPTDAESRQLKPTSTHGLTAGKANLVRAAFKAGVKPTTIARQFGVSQAVIREVLRS
jgi:hypothetical protein